LADRSPFRYRAFLSYSHRDRELGDRLHRELEDYRIPRDLVGKFTTFGSVPRKLRPIFRDRYDLEAGHSLREQLIEALKSSEALIVMCSPAAAASPYVNEEIRLFKATGRSQRVYPVIVAGEPGDAARECFPRNLLRRVDSDGVVTGDLEEPIAADMRDHGDGAELARLKLIAGLLGVDLDELRRREDGERRRRQRRLVAVAAVMTLLAILAIVFAGYSQVLNSRLTEALASETAAKKEAQQRYAQALTSTLRLVTIAATFRSLSDGTPFQTSQVAEKGASDEFQMFLATSSQPDAIWFRLVQVLMNFANELPPELRRYRQQLDEQNMRLQWAEHAALIMGNLIGREPDRPDYKLQIEIVRSEIARLGGHPREDGNSNGGGNEEFRIRNTVIEP
jgi:Na+-transporting methylmalonyl-CoA/oxaloacetate decarboxylase gamma subunit